MVGMGEVRPSESEPEGSRQPLLCARCKWPVVIEADRYDVFEQMHYVCFHYEFEHGDADPDEECWAGGCPSAAIRPRPDRRPPIGAHADPTLTDDQAFAAAAHFVRQYYDRGRSAAIRLMLQSIHTDPATVEDWRASVDRALAGEDPYSPAPESPHNP